MVSEARTVEDRTRLVCPTCSRISEPGVRLCRACMRNLEGERSATESEIQAHLIEETQRTRRAFRKRLLTAAALVVLAMVVGFYYTLVLRDTPPEPLPLGSSSRSVAASGAWNAAGGGLGATRTSDATVNLAAPVAWQWSPDSDVVVPIVADEAHLYLGLADGRIVALSVEDGAVEWESAIPGVLDGAPTVADGLLYVGLRNGEVRALDTETGEVAWSERTGLSIGTAPVIAEGIVYAASNGRLALLDADDGTIIWDRDLEDSVTPVRPVVEGDDLIVGTWERVLLFDRITGEQTSWYDVVSAERPVISLAIEDGTVVSVTSGSVTAVDVEMRRPWYDGVLGAWRIGHLIGLVPPPPWQAMLWSADAPRGVLGAAVGDGRIIVAGATELVALDKATGEVLWQQEGLSPTAAPVLTADGVLLAQQGGLTLHDPATGEVLSTSDVEAAVENLAVTEHGLYATTADGQVIALR